jgi:hypothetical protein
VGFPLDVHHRLHSACGVDPSAELPGS